MGKKLDKNKPIQYLLSPPEPTKKITPLSLEVIARAVRIAIQHSGKDRAEKSWDWHPLYQQAIEIINIESINEKNEQ
jgi:hypothetical protein